MNRSHWGGGCLVDREVEGSLSFLEARSALACSSIKQETLTLSVHTYSTPACIGHTHACTRSTARRRKQPRLYQGKSCGEQLVSVGRLYLHCHVISLQCTVSPLKWTSCCTNSLTNRQHSAPEQFWTFKVLLVCISMIRKDSRLNPFRRSLSQ